MSPSPPASPKPDSPALNRLDRLGRLDQVSLSITRWGRILGQAISWLTVLMAVGTLLVVILRYAFDTGATALQEAVLFLHALVFMLGMGYTLQCDRHVRVDVLYHRFSLRTRCLVNIFGTLLLLFPLVGFIFIESLDYVELSWRTRERSPEAGGLPGVYLLKSLIPLMAIALGIQAFGVLCSQISQFRHNQVRDPGGERSSD